MSKEFQPNEQIHYGDYTKLNSDISKTKIEPLFRSIVRVSRDEVFIQTSESKFASTQTYDKNSSIYSDIMLHDILDHGFGTPILHSFGAEAHHSLSSGEEDQVYLLAKLRKDKLFKQRQDYLLNLFIIHLDKKIIRLTEKINKTKELNPNLEKTNPDRIYNIQITLDQAIFDRNISYLIYGNGERAGLIELYQNLKAAENIFLRILPGILNHELNFTLESIVSKKPNIPKTTREILTNFVKKKLAIKNGSR